MLYNLIHKVNLFILLLSFQHLHSFTKISTIAATKTSSSFSLNKKSKNNIFIIHQQNEKQLKRRNAPVTKLSMMQSIPNEDESWYVKTETFSKPFPIVKPYLEEHRRWVEELRSQGCCVTSGYRVDSEGKPGGGGLMIFAAKDYDSAREFVMNDPLIVNDCVDWQLNGWIAEVGDMQLR